MPYCSSCKKFFDMDDFMDTNITESDVCPDCYFGGGMVEPEDEHDPYDDDTQYHEEDLLDDELDEDDEDSRVIQEMLGNDFGNDIDDEEFEDEEFFDEEDYEDRIEAEEGDYE